MKKALTLLILAGFILSMGLTTAHTSDFQHDHYNMHGNYGPGIMGSGIFGWIIGILLVILLIVLIFYFLKRIESMEKKHNSKK